MAIATKSTNKEQAARHQYGRSPETASLAPSTAAEPATTAQHSFRRLITALLVLLIIAALWVGREPVMELVSLVGDQEAVSNYIIDFGAWGPLVLALGQFIQVLVAFIPGHVFLIAAGYVYGFPAGFLLNLVCIVGASQLAFMLARWVGRPLVNRLAPADVVDQWQAIADRRGVLFFTIAFVLPAFPTDVMNFAAGLSGLSPRRFLAANIMGRLPNAVMLTLIGSHGLELSTTAWAVLLAVVVLLYVGGRYLMLHLERHHDTPIP